MPTTQEKVRRPLASGRRSDKPVELPPSRERRETMERLKGQKSLPDPAPEKARPFDGTLEF